MGIILKKSETGVIKYFLKGADSVIQEKVSKHDKYWIMEEA